MTRRSSTALAIVLPGLRYGADRPLLRGMVEVLSRRGFDLAVARFGHAEDAAFMAADEAAQIAQIAGDGRDILRACAPPGAYRRVWLVGKSLGTLAMAGALEGAAPDSPALAAIWLTPSLLGTGLLAQMLGQQHPSLVIMGTDDPNHTPEAVARLSAAAHVTLHLAPGANHGFDHAGGPVARDAALRRAIDVADAWIGGLMAGPLAPRRSGAARGKGA